MPIADTKRPKPFTLNLAEEQAVSQRNYARLLRLFPNWSSEDARTIYLPSGEVVELLVEARDRYSSVFLLRCESQSHGMLSIDCSIRAYHDACLIDVLVWNGFRRVKPRYDYPNPVMHARDEKWQQQRFLGEWFNFCLHNGRSTPATSALPELFT